MSSRREKADPSFLEKKHDNILRFLKECVCNPTTSSNRDGDAAMAVLLDRYLDAATVVDRQVAEELTGTLMHVYKEVSSRAGRSMRKLLLDPGTSVLVLTEIKEHHQRLAKSGPSQADCHIATVVYFAAIASALVFHQEKITSYSRSQLQEAIRKLLDKSWIDSEVKGLLDRAYNALEE